MKKKLVVMLLGVCSFVGFAQEEQEEERGIRNLEGRKHELRVDAAEALAIPALDVSYEYVISKYSGAGASVFIGFGDDEMTTKHNLFYQKIDHISLIIPQIMLHLRNQLLPVVIVMCKHQAIYKCQYAS